jgi:hypothetical protein
MKMKYFLAAAVLALWTFTFNGCANKQSETSTTTSNANPGSRTYSSQDLQHTGKRTSAEQLQAADPAVTAEGGH